MKATYGIASLCLVLLLLAPSQGVSINCFHTLDFTFFNLKPLMLKEGSGNYYTVSHKTETEDRLFNFAFCEALPETLKCNNTLTMATESQSDDFANTCINLTKENGSSQTASLLNRNGTDHIRLNFTSNSPCKGDENYGVTYDVFCDSNIDTAIPVFNERDSTTCRAVIELTHRAGCKVGDLNGLWRFIESNAYIFGAVALILGLYNLVLGRKFVRPTLGLIFCLTTVAVIMFLFYVVIFKPDVKKWVGWLILAVAIILGGIVGFFASKLVRVGVFILGVAAGACVGLLLNNMVFYKINHVAVLWVLMGVFGLTLGVLSFFWYNYILIICTSIIGSYLFIRGISFYAGGYPNEFTIYEKISSGAVSGVPATFYAYMVGMLIICALGIFIQIKIKKREGESEKTYDIYKRV